jgi:hypothetical protein
MGDKGFAGLTGEQIAAWKSEYDKIIGYDDPYPMIFRKPSRPVWSEFVEGLSKAKGKTEAVYRRLCIACCLHPDGEKFEQILEEYPGLGLTIGDELGELCGHRAAMDVKKL